MSNFFHPARHPITGQVESAEWLDDHFGRHLYGVKFSDGSIFRAVGLWSDGVVTDAEWEDTQRRLAAAGEAISKAKASMNNGLYVYIPARLGSTRLPRKMLLPLDGVPLIVRTCQQVGKLALPMMVVTDSQEIADSVGSRGYSARMTGPADNGTERVAAAAISNSRAVGLPPIFDDDWVVIVQGDEPHIPVDKLANFINELPTLTPEIGGATMATAISDKERGDLSVVKVEVNRRGEAVWFSRIDPLSFRHIGVYAYRRKWLFKYLEEPQGIAERTMKLEQIRSLKAGCKIWVSVQQGPFPRGIDTIDDYKAACGSSLDTGGAPG